MPLPRTRYYSVELPIDLSEFDIAKRFTFLKTLSNETGGREGVLIGSKSQFSDIEFCGGVRTGNKMESTLFLKEKLPAAVRLLYPRGVVLEEVILSDFPYCMTTFTSKQLGGKDQFYLQIFQAATDSPNVTFHSNPCNLSLAEFRRAKFKRLDFINDKLSVKDYTSQYDPKLYAFKGGKPLGSNWRQLGLSRMVVFFAVRVYYKSMFFQRIVEIKILHTMKRCIRLFFCKLFCLHHEWSLLSKTAIEGMEKTTAEELKKKITKGKAQGTFDASTSASTATV